MVATEPLVSLEGRQASRGFILARVAAFSAFVLVGYLVFLWFARGAFQDANLALAAVAVVAGVASFFSPCAFPFLPTVLSVQVIRPRNARGGPISAASDGAVAGLGVVVFNVLLGSGIGLVGIAFGESLAVFSPTPSPITVAVRLIVAGALVVFGVLQMFERGFHGSFTSRIAGTFQRLAGGSRGHPSLFLYGFAYTAIGIGCTGPFLAAVILVGLAAGGFSAALLTFLVFALTMAGLMVAVSILASVVGRQRPQALAAHAPRVRRVAGAVLAAFGILLVLFTLYPSLLRGLFP